jgi:crossover junction endodeoxyribonuclease RusA
MNDMLRQEREVQAPAGAWDGMNKTPNAIMVTLPWPNKVLSPNSRAHWAVRSNAVGKARHNAFCLVLEQIGRREVEWPRPHLSWEFCPPSRRRYDVDNLIAQHKAAQDGIADALGIDDSRFVSTYQLGSPVKGGAVHVTIRKAA